MDQNLRICRNSGLLQQIQRRQRTVHTFLATGDDGPHLAVAVLVDQRVDHVVHPRIHHDDDVGNPWIVLEGLDAPAYDRLATHRYELLGVAFIETGAESGGQYHGHYGRGLRLPLFSLCHRFHRKTKGHCRNALHSSSARNPQQRRRLFAYDQRQHAPFVPFAGERGTAMREP